MARLPSPYLPGAQVLVGKADDCWQAWAAAIAEVDAVRPVAPETSGMLERMSEIVTVGSVNADRVPFEGMSAYAMSKAAVVGLTRGMARDLAARGITVNVVQPGPVDTDMNPAGTAFADAMRALLAIKRYGHPEEIAAAVAYLASPEAAHVTGTALSVDGGFLA